MSEQLKPCPFCGGRADLCDADSLYSGHDDDLEAYRVICLDCSSELSDCGEDYPSAEKAITAWNTRAPAPAQSREEEARIELQLNNLVRDLRAGRVIAEQDGNAYFRHDIDPLRAEIVVHDFLTALRSRQSPPLLKQASDKLANALSDEDWGEVASASNDLDEYLAAAPQPSPQGADNSEKPNKPSPQGEDAFSEAVGWIVELQDKCACSMNEDDRFLDVKKAAKMLLEREARLVSVQSSDQGEEASEMQEEADHPLDLMAYVRDDGVYFIHRRNDPIPGMKAVLLMHAKDIEARAALERNTKE